MGLSLLLCYSTLISTVCSFLPNVVVFYCSYCICISCCCVFFASLIARWLLMSVCLSNNFSLSQGFTEQTTTKPESIRIRRFRAFEQFVYSLNQNEKKATKIVSGEHKIRESANEEQGLATNVRRECQV